MAFFDFNRDDPPHDSSVTLFFVVPTHHEFLILRRRRLLVSNGTLSHVTYLRPFLQQAFLQHFSPKPLHSTCMCFHPVDHEVHLQCILAFPRGSTKPVGELATYS
jgi:hypothetical protein